MSTDWRRAGTLALLSALPLLLGCPPRSSVWVRKPATTQHLVFELGVRPGRREARELSELEVSECRTSGRTMWHIAVNSALFESYSRRPMWTIDPAMRRSYDEVTYGEAPAGYAQKEPTAPLVPGYCYMVRTQASGQGIMAFRVGSSGEVIELSRDATDTLLGAFRHGVVRADGSIRPYTPRELDSARRAWHEPERADSLATVRCYAGYRAARTARDSALVDARIPYDTTASGSLTYDDFPGQRLSCRVICTRIGPKVPAIERHRRSECAAPVRKRES